MSEETKQDNEAGEETALREQTPKYNTLRALFKAKDAGKISIGVTHAIKTEFDEDTTYIVGTEGKGRATKQVVLWCGDGDELMKYLLLTVGFRPKETNVDIDDV